MAKLSWTPVRSGLRFCSPACGRGCLASENLSACKKAKQLAKRLTETIGGRWSTRVWENLGWHYSVGNTDRHLEVCDNGGSFSAFLQISGPWGGNHVEHGSTPEAAIKNLLRTAKKQLKPVMKEYVRLAQ